MGWKRVTLTSCNSKIVDSNSIAYLCIHGNVVRAYVSDTSEDSMSANEDHYVIPEQYRPKANTALIAIIRQTNGFAWPTYATAYASGYIAQGKTNLCYGMMAVGEWYIG